MSGKQQNLTVTVLGCGFMGTALLKGILEATHGKDSPVKKYIAAVQRQESAKRLQSVFSQYQESVDVVCGDNVGAINAADVIILGIPPGDAKTVLGDAATANAVGRKLVISMLAGVQCASIRDILVSAAESKSQQDETGSRIIRVMPSIGAQINESATLISKSDLDADSVAVVHWLFDQVGNSQDVPEELLNTAVAISSACHALVVTAIDAIVDGSVSRGIARPAAINIAAQCLRGASSLLLKDMTLEELKSAMSIERGMTTEAWIQLDAGHVRPALSHTVRHTADYAERMA